MCALISTRSASPMLAGCGRRPRLYQGVVVHARAPLQDRYAERASVMATVRDRQPAPRRHFSIHGVRPGAASGPGRAVYPWAKYVGAYSEPKMSVVSEFFEGAHASRGGRSFLARRPATGFATESAN